ncbi:hypothetical protein LT493_09180 [Streptomyces tricolor]|nr:hypothetical protein [Streptomyces tricolor]
MNSTYKIRVGRSTSVTGPYVDSTGKPMLEAVATCSWPATAATPARAESRRSAATARPWLAYHYYDADDDGTPKLGLNELRWRAGRPVLR